MRDRSRNTNNRHKDIPERHTDLADFPREFEPLESENLSKSTFEHDAVPSIVCVHPPPTYSLHTSASFADRFENYKMTYTSYIIVFRI